MAAEVILTTHDWIVKVLTTWEVIDLGDGGYRPLTVTEAEYAALLIATPPQPKR